MFIINISDIIIEECHKSQNISSKHINLWITQHMICFGDPGNWRGRGWEDQKISSKKLWS